MKNYDCLLDLVGLRGVCEEKQSCLWVNDIPGISLKRFAKTADEEVITGKKLFDRLNRESAFQTAEDLIAYMSNDIQLKTNIDRFLYGEWERGRYSEFLDTEDKLYGLEVAINTDDPYITYHVDYIEIHVLNSAYKEICIQDQYGQIEIVPMQLTTGVNRIPLNLEGDYFRIWLNTCDLQIAAKTRCTCDHVYDSCSYCSCSCSYVRRIEREQGEDWKYSQVLPFRICIRCKCDKQRIMCKFKDELAIPIRWRIAAMLMEEVMYSDRRNPLVRNSKDEANRIWATIMGGEDPITGFSVKHPKYWSSLKQAYQRIKGGFESSSCFECSGITVAESIP